MEVMWNSAANLLPEELADVSDAWQDLALPDVSMPPSRKRSREPEAAGDESDRDEEAVQGEHGSEHGSEQGSEQGSAPPEDASQASGSDAEEDEAEQAGAGSGEGSGEEDSGDHDGGEQEDGTEEGPEQGVGAEERIAELEEQLEATKNELAEAKAEIQRLTTPNARAAAGALVPAAAYGAERHKYSVCMLLPDDFNTCAMPKKFKKGKDDDGPGFKFPHAVRAGASGIRTYIVESRLSVVVCWQLHDVTQSTPKAMSQTDEPLNLTQALYFKLEIVHANSGEVVRSADIKTKPTSLVNPSDVLNSQQMNGGKLFWKFKFNFESRKCKNTSQEFKLRVSCTNPEAQRYNLTGESPPFMLVSRNTDKVPA